MKVGLYAGSFDPWSIGHQYVLKNALEVFDALHVLVAVHPFKKSWLDADTRARLVAHANEPTTNWWNVELKQPLVLNNKKLTVSTSDGLVAEYAHKHNIKHLVRGMRSTTDFEAEFNLYFANNAIDPTLQTWAILCPPKLLHCSATYIRAVVGHEHVKSVGTSFAAQAVMLNKPVIIGQLFDLYYAALKKENMLGEVSAELLMNLQKEFSDLLKNSERVEELSSTEVSNQLFMPKKLQSAEYYLNICHS